MKKKMRFQERRVEKGIKGKRRASNMTNSKEDELERTRALRKEKIRKKKMRRRNLVEGENI